MPHTAIALRKMRRRNAKGSSEREDRTPPGLDYEAVQEVTGLAKELVYRLPHTKGFPVVRFGRVFRVPRDAFLKWLEEQATAGGNDGR
jgi:excisionase family DNA binding protein